MGDIKTIIGLLSIPLVAGYLSLTYLLPVIQKIMEKLL
jgi:hypothetical protein